MAFISVFPQGLLNNIIGAAPNNAVSTTPQQAVAAPVQAPPPMELERISSGKIIGYTNEGEQGSPIYEQFLKDPKTGDLYESITSQNYDSEGMISSYNYNPGRLLATGDALKNPDIQNLTNSYNWRGINNPGEKYADPTYASSLSNLKQENPDQYYKTLATDISDQILGNWSMNKNEHNVALTNQLESIKDVNPAAYYQAQLNLLSKQSGWQHGQNTFERAKPYQEKMAELAPKALEAGLSAQQIDSIVGQGFSAASAQNQQRIVNEQQSGGSGFNLGELVRGVAPVAALAVGGPLFSALGAGGAAASSLPSFATAAGKGALLGSALGGGSAALQGGNIGQGLLTGGLTGAVGGGVGSAFGGGLAGNVAGGALAGGTGSLLRGGNPLEGALIGGAGGALLSGINELTAPSVGINEALPYTESYDAFNLAQQGLGAEDIARNLSATGMDSFLATDLSRLAAQGLSESQLNDIIGRSYSPKELAGTGIKSLNLANSTAATNLGIKDALGALKIGGSLLGGGAAQPQQQGAAPTPQNIIPRGQVDYSGILNLLQVPSPQRNMYSLLG